MQVPIACWKFRLVASGVPDVENFDAVRGFADVVENPVGTKDDFAKRSFRAARLGRADKGEGFQNVYVFEDAPTEADGCLRVVQSDIGANVLEVGDRRIRPDYREVHAVAHDSSSFPASS